MEHKIGTIYYYKDLELRVEKADYDKEACGDCYFEKISKNCNDIKCTRHQREDNKNIIYRRI